MTDTEIKTLDKELSALDWEKEFHSKYTSKFTGIFDELSSKYNINSPRLTNNLNILTVQKMNKLNKLKNKIISIDYNRIDQLYQARKEHYFKMVKKSETISEESRKRTKAMGKNELIMKDITTMFDQMKSVKSDTTNSFLALDSLLNSHKNFIIVNKFQQFRDGIPILKLKRENFLQKAKPYMNQKQLIKLEDYTSKNASKNNEELDNSHKIKDMLKTLRKKGKKIFSTELSNNILSSSSSNELERERINSYRKIDDLNQNSPSNRSLSKKQDLNSLRLPKIAVRELSVNIIPEKKELYSDFQIKDLLSMARIKKKPFK